MLPASEDSRSCPPLDCGSSTLPAHPPQCPDLSNAGLIRSGSHNCYTDTGHPAIALDQSVPAHLGTSCSYHQQSLCLNTG